MGDSDSTSLMLIAVMFMMIAAMNMNLAEHRHVSQNNITKPPINGQFCDKGLLYKKSKDFKGSFVLLRSDRGNAIKC